MNEVLECSHCHQPTRRRCSRCKLLLVCSRECFKAVWRTHKPDCRVLQKGRAISVTLGIETENPETKTSLPLSLPPSDLFELVGIGDSVRERHRDTEARLHRGDPSLPIRSKLAYYVEILQAYDSSSNQHENRSLVHKMVMNRQYNVFYRDAIQRLKPQELDELNNEMRRLRIGSFFKQHA